MFGGSEMNPKMQTVYDKDAGDDAVIAAYCRLIRAKLLGWKKYRGSR